MFDTFSYINIGNSSVIILNPSKIDDYVKFWRCERRNLREARVQNSYVAVIINVNVHTRTLLESTDVAKEYASKLMEYLTSLYRCAEKS